MNKCVAVILVLLTGQVLANQPADRACHNLYQLTDLSYAVEPGKLVAASGGVAEHCKTRAVINRAIQVEITMPTQNWNGRMMFSTVGGGAGSIGDITSLLSRGFAMASTDTGHEGQSLEFAMQPEPLLDYAYRGVHLATQLAKATIEKYYQQDISFAYLSGCSNGGRAALLEATLFPDDYDGIIAGAPLFQFLEFLPWAIAGSRKQAAGPLTTASLGLLDRNSRNACDAIDGVADGVINDPRECSLDKLALDELQCKSKPGDDCLTEQQLETARYMYEGLVDNNGKVLSPGVMPGAESAGDWAMWMLPNELLGAGASLSLIDGMTPYLDMLMRRIPEFDIDTFDPVEDFYQLTEVSFLDVPGADLRAFRDNGGKLLIYQGWNDFPLRPGRAIEFVHQANELNGGADATSEFLKMFMVPGMVHCAAGPGAWMTDYVAPMVAWRENGDPPEKLIAVQSDWNPYDPTTKLAPKESGFARPLCVFPALAQYNGAGDKAKAESYSCKVP